MEEKTDIIPIQLDNGAIFRVQATVLGGEEQVAFALPSFQEVTEAIEGVAAAVSTALRRIHPHKGTVTFCMSLVLEAGHLTGLLVKGSGTSNLTITLEWEE